MTQRPNVQITFTRPEDVDAGAAARAARNDEYVTPHTEMGATGVWVLWAALLVLLVAVVFAWSLNGGFITGDDVNVTQNLRLRVWRGLIAIWRLPHQMEQFSPLGYTSLLLEYRLYGVRAAHAAAGYRFTNVALHAVNVLLLWHLLRKLELPGAWLAAAVFAVHPLQVQPVVWVSQRPVLLGTTLLLSALLVYLRYEGLNPPPPEDYQRRLIRLPERPALLWTIAFLLTIAATLAYPGAAAFPLVVLLLIWWERGQLTRHDLKPLIPFFVVTILATAGAAALIYHRRAGDARAANVVGQLLDAARSAWLYVYWTFVPVRLSFAYPPQTSGSHDPIGWLSLVAIVAALIALWATRRSTGRGAFTAAMLFVLALLPGWIGRAAASDATNDYFIPDAAIYLALAAIVVPVIALLAERPARAQRRAIWAWMGGLAVFGLAGLSLWHERAYRDEETLWSDVIDKHPGLVAGRVRLGEIELSRDRPDAADVQFGRVLAANPRNIDALLGRGRVHDLRGERDQALATYTQACEVEPGNADAHFGLANVFMRYGNSADALREFQTVLRLRPRDTATYLNLGTTYEMRGETDEAIRCYRAAIDIDPRFAAARVRLAGLLFGQGDINGAGEELARASAIDPENFELFFNAGALTASHAVAVWEAGQHKPAMDWFRVAENYCRRAASLRPGSADACDNLGQVLAAQARRDPALAGKMKEAVYWFGRASDIDPNSPKYRADLADARRASGTTEKNSGR